jgi:hypothetical protein
MRTIIALAMILTATVANAQQQMVLRGFGASSCSEFAQAYREDPTTVEGLYFTWAQGYMSGANVAGRVLRDLAGRSLENQEAHIRSYCDNHPLSSYAEAVLSLYGTLPTIK